MGIRSWFTRARNGHSPIHQAAALEGLEPRLLLSTYPMVPKGFLTVGNVWNYNASMTVLSGSPVAYNDLKLIKSVLAGDTEGGHATTLLQTDYKDPEQSNSSSDLFTKDYVYEDGTNLMLAKEDDDLLSQTLTVTQDDPLEYLPLSVSSTANETALGTGKFLGDAKEATNTSWNEGISSSITCMGLQDVTLTVGGSPKTFHCVKVSQKLDWTAFSTSDSKYNIGSNVYTYYFDPSVGIIKGDVLVTAHDPDTGNDHIITQYTYQLTSYILGGPQIGVSGVVNSKEVNILPGDTVPTTADATNFGTLAATGASVTDTFRIRNNGQAVLNLTGTPRVQITGVNAADFTVVSQPAATVAVNGFLTFQIKFTPKALWARKATVSIACNDLNVTPFTFDIVGYGRAVPQESLVGVVGGKEVALAAGDTTPTTADGTDFGSAVGVSGAVAHIFRIKNSGSGALTLTGTPKIAITGTNPSDFVVVAQPSSGTVSAGGYVDFTVKFAPTAAGTRKATVHIASNDPSHGSYDFAIQGTSSAAGMGLPVVSISAPIPSATEGKGDSARFTITRTGYTTAPLTVYFARTGAASSVSEMTMYVNGKKLTTNYVVIPAGSSSINIDILPVNDTIKESAEKLVFTLQTNAAYALDSLVLNRSATVSILDND